MLLLCTLTYICMVGVGSIVTHCANELYSSINALLLIYCLNENMWHFFLLQCCGRLVYQLAKQHFFIVGCWLVPDCLRFFVLKWIISM